MSMLKTLLKAAEEIAPLAAPSAWREVPKAFGVSKAMAPLVERIMASENPGEALAKQIAAAELTSAKEGAKAARGALKPGTPGPTLKPGTPEFDEWYSKAIPGVDRESLYRKSGMAKIMSFHESDPSKLAEMFRQAEVQGGSLGEIEPALTLPSVAHQSAEHLARAGSLPGNFGKTALIFGRETVSPELKAVNTFDSDAYLYRRSKHKNEITREGKKVFWIGKRNKRAYKPDPNLMQVEFGSKPNPNIVGVDPAKIIPEGGEVPKGGGIQDRIYGDHVYEWPKNIPRGDVIDAFKVQPTDFYQTFEELPGYTKGLDQTGPIHAGVGGEYDFNYIKPLSKQDKFTYNLTKIWDDRLGRNVRIKMPKREEDLIAYGFKPTNYKTTDFPDMEAKEGGRWIPQDNPEAVRAQLQEQAGDIRFTEGWTGDKSTPTGFTDARAKYANPIKSEGQLRASLGSFKHQRLSRDEMGKLESAGDNFFSLFKAKGVSELNAFSVPNAHEYLAKLEKTGAGGNKAMDELGLQYLAFMKNVPADYYEAKIFRHVPIKEAKALYMPGWLYDEGQSFLEWARKFREQGVSHDEALSRAADQIESYEAHHAATLIEAMAKRKVPIHTNVGDLLKYAWSVAIAGPAAVYIAGDKKGVTK